MRTQTVDIVETQWTLDPTVPRQNIGYRAYSTTIKRQCDEDMKIS